MEAFIPIFAIVFGAAALELMLPGRAYPTMRAWRLKGLVYFVVYLALATAGPLFARSLVGPRGVEELADPKALPTYVPLDLCCTSSQYP